MKKLTAMFAALALFFTATALDSASADEFITLFNLNNSKTVKTEKVNVLIRESFAESYSNAKDVIWKENQGIYFAYFTDSEKQLATAYNTDGELIACSQKIHLDNLSEATLKTLYKKYKDYNISTNVSKITMENETYYYLTVTDSNVSKILKCDSNGGISVFKKIKKKVLVGRVEV